MRPLDPIYRDVYRIVSDVAVSCDRTIYNASLWETTARLCPSCTGKAFGEAGSKSEPSYLCVPCLTGRGLDIRQDRCREIQDLASLLLEARCRLLSLSQELRDDRLNIGGEAPRASEPAQE